MKIIHYTEGYGGKLNYITYCGKEIHSHSETEAAVISPIKVTCAKCKEAERLKQDLVAYNGISSMKRRIYLESDVLHASELRSAQREVYEICEQKKAEYPKRIFNDVIDYAWHDLEATWIAVKLADEIYSDSSLMPLTGGSYVGAPVIFNEMCKKAISEKVTGKSVYILNELKNIHWDMIDLKLMKEAFKENDLYMYKERVLVKVNVSKIKK